MGTTSSHPELQGGPRGKASSGKRQLSVSEQIRRTQETVERFEQRVEKGLAFSKGLGASVENKDEEAVERSFARLAKTIHVKEAQRLFEQGLKSSTLFKGIKDDLVHALFERTVPVFVKKGDVIFEKGSVGQVMFVVLRGSLKAVKTAVRKRTNGSSKTNNSSSTNNISDKNLSDRQLRSSMELEPALTRIRTKFQDEDDAATLLAVNSGVDNENDHNSNNEEGDSDSNTDEEEEEDVEDDDETESSPQDEEKGVVEAVEDKDYGGNGGKLTQRYRFTLAGARKQVRTLLPGKAIATHCVLLNIPHSWRMVAKKDCLLLAVHRLEFQEISLRVSQRQRLLESLDHRVQWLHRFGFLSILEDKELTRLADRLQHRTYGAGEVILKRGEKLPGMFIVLSGTVAYVRPKEYALEYRTLEEQKLLETGTDEDGEDCVSTGKRMSKRMQHDLNEIRWFHQGDAFGRGFFHNQASPDYDQFIMGLEAIATENEDVECLFLDWQIEQQQAVEDSEGNTNSGGVGSTMMNMEKALTITKEIAYNYGQELIHQCPIFSTLSTSDITKLVDQYQVCRFEDGDTIMGMGDPVEVDGSIYLIIEGSVLMEGVILPSVLDRNKRRMSMSKSKGDTTKKATKIIKRLLQRGESQQGLATKALEFSVTPEFLEGNTPYVLLLEGETFGEDVVHFKRQDLNTVSCTAVGSLICAKIPISLLRELDILHKVRQAYYGKSGLAVHHNHVNQIKSGDGISIQQKRKLMGGKKKRNKNGSIEDDAYFADSFSMSQNFLLLHDMLDIQQNGQGGYEPQRQSLLRTVNRENLSILVHLHETRRTNVVLALHAPTGQLCVVKSTNLERSNEEGMGRFAFTEQTILSQLDTPFVTRLLSCWEEKPCNTLVAMEPVLGGKLENYLKARMHDKPSQGPFKCLRFEECRFLAANILVALKHLFEHNIIHRDLKTVNVMLNHHGYAKLADFGISKQLQHHSSRTSTFIGTPKFMAPELAALASGKSSGYGMGVDWWSFGVMLYRFATGETPFESTSTSKKSIDKTFSHILAFGERHRSVGKDNPQLLRARRNDPFLHRLNDKTIAQSVPNGHFYWMHYANFVAELLNPNPTTRLGGTTWGPRSAMQHPLFGPIESTTGKYALEAMDWDALYEQKLKPQLVPKRNDYIIDVKILQEIAKGGKFDVVEHISLDNNNNSEEAKDGMQKDQNEGTSKFGANMKLGLFKALRKMNELQLTSSFHSTTTESMEGEQETPITTIAATQAFKGTIEHGVREKLEQESHSFMSASLATKRMNRQQLMLNNQRKAKILELKHKAQITGTLAPQVLRHAAVTEAVHQILLESKQPEDEEDEASKVKL